MEKHTFIIEDGDHWRLLVDGMQVTQCCFDYQISLLFWRSEPRGIPDTTVYLRISNDFTLTTQGETHCLRTPDEEDPLALGIVISLFLKTVRSMKVFKSGRLELCFTDDTELFVDPSDKYEAWTMNTPEGVVISHPGGGVG